MNITKRVLAYLKEQPGSPQEIGDALGLKKRKWGYTYNWGKWKFDEAEAKGLIEYGKDYKWHLKEGLGMKTKCKYFDMYPNQPPCYRPPFDELMGLGFRTKHLMDFVRDDKELALKELQEMRGILDKVEAKIKEYVSVEAEDLGDNCPECGGPATHPSGL